MTIDYLRTRSRTAFEKVQVLEDSSSISSEYDSDSIDNIDCVYSSQSSSLSSPSVPRASDATLHSSSQSRGTFTESADRLTSWLKGQSSEPDRLSTTLPPTRRQHPRRTVPAVQANDSSARLPPCSLIRQDQRSECFVALLVAFTAGLVAAIWPLSACPPRVDPRFYGGGVLPLKTFIQETLRRSKTSYSTLQVALYYLILLKDHLPKRDLTQEQPAGDDCRAMQCGRRMFLSALVLASKYLQDRNYSTRAWSKISGLRSAEINQNEMQYLQTINWKLHVPKELFDRWQTIVVRLSAKPKGDFPFQRNNIAEGLGWKVVISQLSPDLPQAFDEAIIEQYTDGLAAIKAGNVQSSLPTPPLSPPADESDSSDHEERNLSERNRIGSTVDWISAEPMNGPQLSLPPLPRLHNLPTPQTTPLSKFSATPNLSTLKPYARCPASFAALSNLRKDCMARATLDRCPPPRAQPADQSFANHSPTEATRCSLALKKSISLLSSPESMVSDRSSSSTRSRSSSISSVASSSLGGLQHLRLGKVNYPDCSSTASTVIHHFKNTSDELTIRTTTPIATGVTWDTCSPYVNDGDNPKAPSHEDLTYPAAIFDITMSSVPPQPLESHVTSLCDLEAAAALCNLRPRLDGNQATLQSSAIPSAIPSVKGVALPRCKIDIGPAKSHKRSHSKVCDALQTQVRKNLSFEDDVDNIGSPDGCSLPSQCPKVSQLNKAAQSPSKGWAFSKTPVPVQGTQHSKRWCATETQNPAADYAARLLRPDLQQPCW